MYLPSSTHLIKKETRTGVSGGKGLNPCNSREHDREDFTVMRPFHQLLKDSTKEIREAGISLLPTNLLKVSSFGENSTFSNLSPPDQPSTCMIAVFNGKCRNTCSLEHQDMKDAHAKVFSKKLAKGSTSSQRHCTKKTRKGR